MRYSTLRFFLSHQKGKSRFQVRLVHEHKTSAFRPSRNNQKLGSTASSQLWSLCNSHTQAEPNKETRVIGSWCAEEIVSLTRSQE